jgi:hypothetical protein
VSLSIGYTVNKDGAEYKDGTRYLKSVRLWETSLVNIPANPLALVGAVKDASLADELPFADHLDAVADAVEDTARRVKARAEMRQKEGRVLSTANLEKIRRMHDAMTEMMPMLQDLIDAGAPKVPAEGDAAEAGGEMPKASAAEIDRIRLRARLLGASLGIATS